ncbi:MAG: type III polyketide synthase [Hyphomicrobiales bacterium]|nr:type III polyketide synthase [Hyphomicrobiales bacterium]
MLNIPSSAKRPLLRALVTAVPANVLEQRDVAVAAEALFSGRMGNFKRLKPVFDNAGIARRYAACPADWYTRPNDWQTRNDAYVRVSCQLFAEAAGKALAEAGLTAAEIDTIVTVSSTGIATPTIEARQVHGLGFRDTVRRVPVFGLGCAGGATGVSLAARLAAAEPGSNVLVVVIELCTLAFQYQETSKSNVVASALFGDGAAAAIVSTAHGDALAEFEHTGEHTWPETLDIMGWRVDGNGLGVIFDRSIPAFVKQQMHAATLGFLENHDLSLGDIDGLAFHPGGAKVLDALEEVFALDQGVLNTERGVLHDYGNMSAPTVMFVLLRALQVRQGGRHLVSALGPGFTASYATLIN